MSPELMTGDIPEQPANPIGITSSADPAAPGGLHAPVQPFPPPLDSEPPPGICFVPSTGRGATGSHRPEDLERLLQVNMTLSRVQNLDDLLYRILDNVKEMMDAEDSSIMLLDPLTQTLRFAAIASPFRDALQGVSLQLGEGIAGWVARNGEVLIVDDAYSDPRFSPKGDAASGHRTANMMCLPLKTPDRIIGTLQVINRLGGRYTAEDVPLCLSLANIAAIAIENVTLHQVTEHSLKAIQQLEESRTEFINLMSHELRTPLTIIQGGLDILRSGMPIDAATRDEFLRSMNANAIRLKRLVDDIFIINDMAALRDHLILREVDMLLLARVFENFYESESNAPRLQLDLPREAGGGRYVVQGDREKLIHCISHLLDNARKFSPPGSTVRLQVTRDEALGSLRVTVSDPGIGIEQEAQEKVFDRFYQVDSSLTRKYGGTGVGLYVCRKIVEVHGGMIWCHSRPDAGSDFSFALPLPGEGG